MTNLVDSLYDTLDNSKLTLVKRNEELMLCLQELLQNDRHFELNSILKKAVTLDLHLSFLKSMLIMTENEFQVTDSRAELDVFLAKKISPQ